MIILGRNDLFADGMFSLLFVGPTQSGKTYFGHQILKHNCIMYGEQKSIRIFWYYIQWQECYEKLKKSLRKSIGCEKVFTELSKNLWEINPRYNTIIILDDLMAKATDSSVVFRLFTQGHHGGPPRPQVFSYCWKTCFLKGNIIRILAQAPST